MSHVTQPVILAMIVCTAVILLAVVVLGRKLSLKVGKVHAEFAPNGGSSMRDAMNRLERGMHLVYDRLDILEKHDAKQDADLIQQTHDILHGDDLDPESPAA